MFFFVLPASFRSCVFLSLYSFKSLSPSSLHPAACLRAIRSSLMHRAYWAQAQGRKESRPTCQSRHCYYPNRAKRLLNQNLNLHVIFLRCNNKGFLPMSQNHMTICLWSFIGESSLVVTLGSHIQRSHRFVPVTFYFLIHADNLCGFCVSSQSSEAWHKVTLQYSVAGLSVCWNLKVMH